MVINSVKRHSGYLFLMVFLAIFCAAEALGDEAQIESLISQMTLEEKVDQMNSGPSYGGGVAWVTQIGTSLAYSLNDAKDDVELALYHNLGALPEPIVTHKFF